MGGGYRGTPNAKGRAYGARIVCVLTRRAPRPSCTPKTPGRRKWPNPGSCPALRPVAGWDLPALETLSLPRRLHSPTLNSEPGSARLPRSSGPPHRHRTHPLRPPSPLPRPPPPPPQPRDPCVSHRRRGSKPSGPPPGGNSRAHSGREGGPFPPHTRRSPKTEARGQASGSCRVCSRGNGSLGFATGQPSTAGDSRARPSEAHENTRKRKGRARIRSEAGL